MCTVESCPSPKREKWSEICYGLFQSHFMHTKQRTITLAHLALCVMSTTCWGAILTVIFQMFTKGIMKLIPIVKMISTHLNAIVMWERCLTVILQISYVHRHSSGLFSNMTVQRKCCPGFKTIRNCHIITYKNDLHCKPMRSEVIRKYFILYCTGKERHEKVATRVLTWICNQSWSILHPIFLFMLSFGECSFCPMSGLGR